jgi:hypothetical protein
MFRLKTEKSDIAQSLDPLDRVAIAYLTLPVAIFLLGWFKLWVSLPLAACLIYALRFLVAGMPVTGAPHPVTLLQVSFAVAGGCGWTFFGGTDHFVFANFDWYVRDAVLHDLVVAHWPVSYGLVDGKESLLRAPVAYYLPAALIGKLVGVSSAHLAMAAWTAVGASLFLLQVLSLTASRASICITVIAIVVLFSGFDVIGGILNDGSRFFENWNIAKNLESWAGTYQYSSMTTQLFWAPNHALGGWLTVGLLFRDGEGTRLDPFLPVLVVATALWSPLTCLGLMPFIIWKAMVGVVQDRAVGVLHPRIWLPVLPIGLVMAAYLALNTEGIEKGLFVDDKSPAGIGLALLRNAEFFLLEAGLIGFAVLAIRRSSQIVLALLILALLPLIHMGPGNDLVMRASIPALTVLAIGAARAISSDSRKGRMLRKKIVLCCLLVIGAVTPIQEFARAAILPAWPIELRSNLIEVNCGEFPPHYVALLSGQNIRYLLLPLRPLYIDWQFAKTCRNSAKQNPATALMYQYGLLR